MRGSYRTAHYGRECHRFDWTVGYCIESTAVTFGTIGYMLRRLRSEMRLGLGLGLAAVFCFVAGSILYEKMWGPPAAAAGFSALWTICVLIVESRRLKEGSSGRFSVLRLGAGWGSVVGLLGASRSVDPPLTFAGSLAGVIVTVAIWLVATPSSSARGHVSQHGASETS